MYKDFRNIRNQDDRHYASLEYKDEGYRIVYTEKNPEQKAIGFKMILEANYDEIDAGGMAIKPTYGTFAQHFINAQWGDMRYPDEMLEILQKEFGEIDGPACVMPGYSSWTPDFQTSRSYLYEVLPKLSDKQKQQIKGL